MKERDVEINRLLGELNIRRCQTQLLGQQVQNDNTINGHSCIKVAPSCITIHNNNNYYGGGGP